MDFQINIGIKLQGEDSNSGSRAKPSSDTIINNQLSQKLKLVEFWFNMNIMLQHPQNDVILVAGSPKRRRFGGVVFFFF